MSNMENVKKTLIIEQIHQLLAKNKEKSGTERQEFIQTNQLLELLCHDINMGPLACAEAMNQKYGYNMNNGDVIRIFRDLKIANPEERKKLFKWAKQVAEYFAGAAEGNKRDFEQFEKIRREGAVESGRRHLCQERIAALMIYTAVPELMKEEDFNNLMYLGNTRAKFNFYDMIDIVAEIHGFPQHRGKKAKKETSEKSEKKMSYEQAQKQIASLENALERSNLMLEELQNEFEEQLQQMHVTELADFFARLNSEKYGCILDELLVVRKGIDRLKKSNYELPVEINGLLIMVKKLIQFIRDSHIEPIMKIGSIKPVTADEIEFCEYEGSPFTTSEEVKTVKVISPGWIYKDMEVQISRPKVKEELQ